MPLPSLPTFFDKANGAGQLAYRRLPGRKAGTPEIVICGGLHSNTSGDKSEKVENWASSRGLGCTRFDYRGHGLSSGTFNDFEIGDWVADAIDIIQLVHSSTAAPIVLVSSSFSGWIALQIAVHWPSLIKGLLLIAAAVDITHYWLASFTAEEREQAEHSGRVLLHSDYDANGTELKIEMLHAAEPHLLLGKPGGIPVTCPVRVMHGLSDTLVPPEVPLAVTNELQSQDVRLMLIKDGDHRLSRPQDMKIMIGFVDDLVKLAAATPPAATSLRSYRTM